MFDWRAAIERCIEVKRIIVSLSVKKKTKVHMFATAAPDYVVCIGRLTNCSTHLCTTTVDVFFAQKTQVIVATYDGG